MRSIIDGGTFERVSARVSERMSDSGERLEFALLILRFTCYKYLLTRDTVCAL